MTGALVPLFAVTLLLDPPGVNEPVATPSETPAATNAVTAARITSRTSDFDGKAGVVMFEGDVCVRYSEEFSMCADRLYMFLAGSNELSRVVAVGAVSITNENRVGTCAMATYRRRKGEVEMFWDGKETPARLIETKGGVRSLEGTRIRFWLERGQAEVENTRITSGTKEGGTFL